MEVCREAQLHCVFIQWVPPKMFLLGPMHGKGPWADLLPPSGNSRGKKAGSPVGSLCSVHTVWVGPVEVNQKVRPWFFPTMVTWSQAHYICTSTDHWLFLHVVVLGLLWCLNLFDWTCFRIDWCCFIHLQFTMNWLVRSYYWCKLRLHLDVSDVLFIQREVDMGPYPSSPAGS